MSAVDHRRARHGARSGQQRQSPFADTWTDPAERGDDVAPEARRIVVVLVEREPGDRPIARRGPGGEERRLAETRWRADQAEVVRRRVVDARHEVRPRQHLLANVRHHDLGREEVVVQGSAHLRGRRKRRFGHAVSPAGQTIRRITGPHFTASTPPKFYRTDVTVLCRASVGAPPRLVETVRPGSLGRVSGQVRRGHSAAPRRPPGRRPARSTASLTAGAHPGRSGGRRPESWAPGTRSARPAGSP